MLKALAQLTHLPYFTPQGVMQLTQHAEKSVLVMLSRLVKQGKIIRLKRGYYMSQEFYLINHREFYFSNLVSNIIQPASYLSREYVLQAHNILTEITYPVTAVTTKNTQQITNKIGNFDYAHLKNDLYDGYEITYHHQIACAQATLGKALFDYLYLRSFPNSLLKNYSLQEELRLNLENFSSTDWEVFQNHVAQASSPKMSTILNNLKKYSP